MQKLSFFFNHSIDSFFYYIPKKKKYIILLQTTRKHLQAFSSPKVREKRETVIRALYQESKEIKFISRITCDIYRSYISPHDCMKIHARKRRKKKKAKQQSKNFQLVERHIKSQFGILRAFQQAAHFSNSLFVPTHTHELS